MKIITQFIYPPIPDRRWDWQAIFENYDGASDSNHPMGFGKTKEDAIQDLLGRYEECPKCGEVERYYWLKSSGWCAKCDFRWGT